MSKELELIRENIKNFKEALEEDKTVGFATEQEAQDYLQTLENIEQGLLKANEYEELMEEYGITNIREALITARMFEGDSEANLKKKARVWEIIKEKLINFRKFYNDFAYSNISYDKYLEFWDSYGCEKLTQEEWDLLKEMKG